MTNAKLKTAVTKAAKATDVGALGDVLLKIVAATKRKTIVAPVTSAPQSSPTLPAGNPLAEALRQSRRQPRYRNSGRNRQYRSTGKPDISRVGTFRHYLIQTVRQHEWTRDAERAHANCENPKFAKNKLDIGWCAAEGYIEFI